MTISEKKKKVMTTITLREEYREHLKFLARESGLASGQYIEKLIDEKLKKTEK
jgi:predicted DNA-binding protein